MGSGAIEHGSPWRCYSTPGRGPCSSPAQAACRAEGAERKIPYRANPLRCSSEANDPVRIKLADQTGQSLERITSDMDGMLRLTAQDAVSYGIVDEVLTAEQYSEVPHRS